MMKTSKRARGLGVSILGALAALTACGSGEREGDGHLEASQPSSRLDELSELPRELVIEQLALRGLAMGEATLIVAPTGGSVLIDVGGASHAPEVLSQLERRLGAREIDWLVLTHHHEDHLGAFEALFSPSEVNGHRPVSIRRGLVWRGPFDVEDSVAFQDTFLSVCRWSSTARAASQRFELCEGGTRPTCTGTKAGWPWPAAGCAGLRRGDLTSRADDGLGALSFIDLGGGVRITFLAVNAFVADRDGVSHVSSFGVDVGWKNLGHENARSLAAVVQYGAFTYLFAGDLTGGGKRNAPDVEAVLARVGPEILERPKGRALLARGSVNLLHLSHHATRSSTNQAWVDWLLPADGRARNAVSGAGNSYWGAPAQDVLDRVMPRLHGGAVWMNDDSFGSGSAERLHVLKDSVLVRVREGGRRYGLGPALSVETGGSRRSTADAGVVRRPGDGWEDYESTDP